MSDFELDSEEFCEFCNDSAEEEEEEEEMDICVCHECDGEFMCPPDKSPKCCPMCGIKFLE